MILVPHPHPVTVPGSPEEPEEPKEMNCVTVIAAPPLPHPDHTCDPESIKGTVSNAGLN